MGARSLSLPTTCLSVGLSVCLVCMQAGTTAPCPLLPLDERAGDRGQKTDGQDRQLDSQPDRQPARQTDRQTDRPTDRQTERDTRPHTEAHPPSSWPAYGGAHLCTACGSHTHPKKKRLPDRAALVWFLSGLAWVWAPSSRRAGLGKISPCACKLCVSAGLSPLAAGRWKPGSRSLWSVRVDVTRRSGLAELETDRVQRARSTGWRLAPRSQTTASSAAAAAAKDVRGMADRLLARQ